MLFGWRGDSPLDKLFQCMTLRFLRLICMLRFCCSNGSCWHLTKINWGIWIWAKILWFFLRKWDASVKVSTKGNRESSSNAPFVRAAFDCDSFGVLFLDVEDQGIWDVVFIHLRHDIVSDQQLCLLKGAIRYFQFGRSPSSTNEAHSTK